MVEVMVGVGYVMPHHDYQCPKHGKFEVMVPIGENVPKTAPCPVPIIRAVFGRICEYDCPKEGQWVPPTVSFPGGPTTGAKPPSLPEE